MDSALIQKVKNQIQALQSLDINAKLAAAYSKEQDLNNISIGRYSVFEFAKAFQRMAKQLSEELDSDSAIYLPYQYQWHNEYGGGNLESDINQAVSYLNSNQFPSALGFLDRLVYYQVVNGFWDRSTRKIHVAAEVKTAEVKQKLDLLAGHINENAKQNQEQLQELTREKEALVKLVAQKNAELQELTRKLAEQVNSATNNTAEINKLLVSSTDYTGKIDNLLQLQTQKIKEESQKFDDLKETQRVFNDNLSSLRDKLGEEAATQEKQNQDFKKHLDFAQQNEVFIADKQKEIIKLTGFAADGSLGHTFNKRKEELQPAVDFWRWAIIIMTALTFGWVFTVFHYLSIGVSSDWLWLINLAKTVPAFVLLGFTIKQYSKERNLQEEYAFKAAVAMTISAYADTLDKGKDNKELMLLEAIRNVYNSPKILPEGNIFSLNSRPLTNTIKDLASVVGELSKRVGPH